MLGGMFGPSVSSYQSSLCWEPSLIYYKQISEGYEDRDRFVLQRSMDEKQIRQTIRKQILIVFPTTGASRAQIWPCLSPYFERSCLLLVFLTQLSYLAVTLGVCAIFFINYVIVFMITSTVIVKLSLCRSWGGFPASYFILWQMIKVAFLRNFGKSNNLY